MIWRLFRKKYILGGKIGVAATLAPKGLGSQNLTKKLAHWVKLLGQPLSKKKVFENLGPEMQNVFENSQQLAQLCPKTCVPTGHIIWASAPNLVSV